MSIDGASKDCTHCVPAKSTSQNSFVKYNVLSTTRNGERFLTETSINMLFKNKLESMVLILLFVRCLNFCVLCIDVIVTKLSLPLVAFKTFNTQTKSC